MASIIDSLVTHIERRVVGRNSQERISAEVLNEFMADVQTLQKAPQVQPQERPQIQAQEVTKPEPSISVPEPIKEEPKQTAPAFVPPVQEEAKPETVEIKKDVEGLSLEELRIHGNSCSACEFNLGEKRSKDTGLNPDAKLMIISEPSGRTDDHMIDPFHGEAGDLLLKMISAMKIDLDEMYICMAHKCFGPGAREKIIETKPFLEKQIELVKPEVILIFGGAALNILLGEQSLMKNRGKWLDINGIPTMSTFPPAYLQQKAEAKREAWNDMQQVMARLK